MPLPPRRALLAAPLLLAPAGAFAQAAAEDPRRTDRVVGKPDARVTVIEYFSLTCGHCAAFHRDTWPRVKTELVEPGRVRVIQRDFPLDRLALLAHAIARAVPVERYDAFLTLLFAQQDRWAFARGSDPVTELARLAAMAGLPRAQFDEAANDADLQRWILEQRLRAEQEHRVQSTPTFVFGNRPVAGNTAFARFAELVREAGG